MHGMHGFRKAELKSTSNTRNSFVENDSNTSKHGTAVHVQVMWRNCDNITAAMFRSHTTIKSVSHSRKELGNGKRRMCTMKRNSKRTIATPQYLQYFVITGMHKRALNDVRQNLQFWCRQMVDHVKTNAFVISGNACSLRIKFNAFSSSKDTVPQLGTTKKCSRVVESRKAYRASSSADRTTAGGVKLHLPDSPAMKPRNKT